MMFFKHLFYCFSISTSSTNCTFVNDTFSFILEVAMASVIGEECVTATKAFLFHVLTITKIHVLWIPSSKRINVPHLRCHCYGVGCNTLNESPWNKMDPKVVQTWNCTIDDDLKELISITYTNKMHLLFGSPSLKNFTIKRVWLRLVMGWVKVS